MNKNNKNNNNATITTIDGRTISARLTTEQRKRLRAFYAKGAQAVARWNVQNPQARAKIRAMVDEVTIPARLRGTDAEVFRIARSVTLDEVVAEIARRNIRAIHYHTAKTASGCALIHNDALVGGASFVPVLKIGGAFCSLAQFVLANKLACAEIDALGAPKSLSACVKSCARLVIALREVGKRVKIWGVVAQEVARIDERNAQARVKELNAQARRLARSASLFDNATASELRAMAHDLEKRLARVA